MSGTNQAMTWHMIGHSWAEELLKKHIRTDQVRQAYLLTGSDGLGKRTLAIRFAQALNCTAPKASGDICGECRACTLIPTTQFPDFHEIVPEEDTSRLKVEQIRELQQKLALSPYEGTWRIALLPDFENATENAANALLKTLEEPSENVIVLLTAVDVPSLLPTIVSRCEHLPLRAVSNEIIRETLLRQGVEGEQAELIAGLAQGRPGWAIRYANDPELLVKRAELLDQLSQLLHQSKRERFDYVERFLPRRDELDTQRHNVQEALQIWMGVWRDAMQRGFNVAGENINPDRSDLIEVLNQKLSPQQIHACVHALKRAQHTIERFANVRLTMEVLMLELPNLE
ncbi:MAG: DNA polymerase III subunit delta' [Anaerolineales bacterium]|nr:MAG: DNA polymerase III subunit delta' [Anaerolineales bacterium]